MWQKNKQAMTLPSSSKQRPNLRLSFSARVERWLPKLILSPSIALSLIFFYGFILVTGYLSLTNSHLLPNYAFSGLGRYRELFANEVWWVAAANLGWFGLPFIGASIGLGLLLAILLDQKIRCEGALRAIFLYPMALSAIVAGTAWQWILNPSLGLEKIVQDWGWKTFSFAWLADPDKAIFCVVIAAVWQAAGFAMALFLAGLRSIDDSIFKAAQVDGANLPTIYWKIVLPNLWPVFFSVLLILCHLAIKTFDLVVALTAGGPGTASSLPALFIYSFYFERGELGIGAAASIMMLVTVCTIVAPLMYLESRSQRRAS